MVQPAIPITAYHAALSTSYIRAHVQQPNHRDYPEAIVLPPPALLSWLNALDDFAKLQPNWDGDGAEPPAPSAIAGARACLYQLFEYGQQEILHLCPGPVGEIAIDLAQGSRELNLIFYPDRSVYVFSDATLAVPVSGTYSPDRLPILLQRLVQS